MIISIITLLTYIVVFLLCIKKPTNILYIAIVDSMITYRFYDNYVGIPFSLFFIVSIIISLILNRRKISINLNFLTRYAIFIVVYFFLSNYSYFKSIDITIFNNLILLFIIQNSDSHKNLQKTWESTTKLFSIMGVIISIDVLIPFVSIFGNPRQLGFYILISIIFNIANRILNNKAIFSSTNYTLIFLYLSLFLTFGRLNLLIGFIIILITYYTKYKIGLKSIFVFFTLIISAFIFFQSELGKSYIYRNIENTNSFELDFEDQTLNALTSGRAIIYKDAWDMFQDNKIFGYGYKSFNDINNPYNSIHSWGSTQKKSMHSVFLQYLSETGIVGFLLYFLFLFLIIRKGISLKKKYLKFEKTQPLIVSIYYVFLLLPLIMMLGSLLDNHGIHYKHLFIILGLLPGIELFFKCVKNETLPKSIA